MVLCLGWATRLVEYYQGHDKRYLAEIALGCETDTLDALGKIVDTAPIPSLTSADIEAALGQFRGEITQLPPVYSAIKQDGESLHYRARRGEVVDVPLRQVQMHQIDLLGYTKSNRIALDIRCSAGTYIRSLARDLGLALGTRGTLVGLRRLEAGPFALDAAVTIAEIEQFAASGALTEHLLAPGTGLDLPIIVIDSATAERLGHGQVVMLANETSTNVAQARDESGRLLGILTSKAPSQWKADKWFANQLLDEPSGEALN